MDLTEFGKVKDQFSNADVNGKIEMYVSAEGLTQDQYVELLRLFPMEELGRLEAALH